MKQSTLQRRQRGFSLLEIMVSLVIGLVVVGAVLVSYMASGKAGKQQAAYAEMNENAQIALGILSRDLLLAGYASPTGLVTVGTVTTFGKTYAGRAVFGCNQGFATPNTLGTATCGTTGTPSLEVAYEADLTNTVPTSTLPTEPSDCLGNRLTATGAFFVTYNRYYLTSSSAGRSELHCASAAQDAAANPNPGQPLVDNVDAMKIWYGEAANAASRSVVVRYVTADDVTDWNLIVSVRVCLLMRSSDPVLQSGGDEDTLTYLDCDSAQQTSNDRFLRRAYFTTTTLRNKMAF